MLIAATRAKRVTDAFRLRKERRGIIFHQGDSIMYHTIKNDIYYEHVVGIGAEVSM